MITDKKWTKCTLSALLLAHIFHISFGKYYKNLSQSNMILLRKTKYSLKLENSAGSFSRAFLFKFGINDLDK